MTVSFLQAVVLFSMCCFQLILLSRVTPRYFTVSENGIFIPSIFTNFLSSYFFFCMLDLENSITTVLLALKVCPHVCPHWDRSLHTLFSLCAIYSMSVPPTSPLPSSADNSPVTPFEFRILAASSKAIIQNLALHTPPCGNHMLSYVVSRFL